MGHAVSSTIDAYELSMCVF